MARPSVETRFTSLGDNDRQCQACHGTLDVNSVLGNTERPPCHVQYEGLEWIKFNCDTGATTALLVELAEGLPLRKVMSSPLRTVRTFPPLVEPSFKTVDEIGSTRKMGGQVTEAHKPPASARLNQQVPRRVHLLSFLLVLRPSWEGNVVSNQKKNIGCEKNKRCRYLTITSKKT